MIVMEKPIPFPSADSEKCIKVFYLVPGDDCNIHVIPGSPMAVYFCVPKMSDPLIEFERK